MGPDPPGPAYRSALPRVRKHSRPTAPTLEGRRRAPGGGRARPAHLKVKQSARGAEPSAALDRPRQLRPGAGDARGRAGPATRPAPLRAPRARPGRTRPAGAQAPTGLGGTAPSKDRDPASTAGAGPRLPPAREWSALKETHTLHYCLISTKFCHTAEKVWRLTMTQTQIIPPLIALNHDVRG